MVWLFSPFTLGSLDIGVYIVELEYYRVEDLACLGVYGVALFLEVYKEVEVLLELGILFSSLRMKYQSINIATQRLGIHTISCCTIVSSMGRRGYRK